MGTLDPSPQGPGSPHDVICTARLAQHYPSLFRSVCNKVTRWHFKGGCQRLDLWQGQVDTVWAERRQEVGTQLTADFKSHRNWSLGPVVKMTGAGKDALLLGYKGSCWMSGYQLLPFRFCAFKELEADFPSYLPLSFL